jgi:hypothetical protein
MARSHRDFLKQSVALDSSQNDWYLQMRMPLLEEVR